MKITGLDPSLTSTGVCVLGEGEPVARTVKSGGHKGDSDLVLCSRILTIRNEVMGHIPADTDLVVIEGPVPYLQHGAFERAWLWGQLYSALAARGIRVAKVPPSSLKLFTANHGQAKKPMMREAVEKMWPGVPLANDDEVDALALASVGAVHVRRPVPFLVLERHHMSISEVKWPAGLTRLERTNR